MGVLFAHVYCRKKCVEGDGKYLVKDEMCLLPEQLAETVGRAGAALALVGGFFGLLARLRG